MFHTAPSTIEGAGYGLFASRKINRHETCTFDQSRRRSSNKSTNSFIIDAYLPRECSNDTLCIWDGVVTPLLSRMNNIDSMMTRPSFVHVAKTNDIMRANDLGMTKGCNVEEYIERSRSKNKFDLVLGFFKKKFDGIYLIALEDTSSGEEIGLTYGPGFWFDSDPLPENAPAPV